MTRNLQAIILAAGEGARMKSELPKVAHAICGRPMISYALNLAASAGAKQPVVVLGHGAELVKPLLPKEATVVLQPKPVGTGDAVLTAKKALGSSGTVLILYADTPLLRRTTVQKLVEAHFKVSAACTLLTAHLADPSDYGRVVRNEAGLIAGIVEEAEATAAQRAIREINVGPLVCEVRALMEALAGLKPSAVKRELYLTEIIAHVARQEGAKIASARVEEAQEALGVNSRADLARATGVIRQRILDIHLHNGVTIEDPSTTVIHHGVSIGADTVIHPCTVIETGVSIGRRCSIGPFARIRSGVAIGEGARIGNFVELVRTKVGPRVRVNHMAYLGDAAVEEDVNIGAGTITANYDGQRKHETHIGKGAFLGCNTVLIAPVKIGAGAVTGAGAVVPKAHDVPAHTVVVGVPAHRLDHRPAADAQATAPTGQAHPAAPERGRAPQPPAHAGSRRHEAMGSRPAAARRRAAATLSTAGAGRPTTPSGAAASSRSMTHRAARAAQRARHLHRARR
jgi:bifunctional UDP-N-acetylglucosamine pyrophosphorylase/glucosamine-1-phosphate N-acetyltransferase